MTGGNVLRLALFSCVILAGGLMLSPARALATGGEPTIGSESATNITEHSATLEAQIYPNGLETAYEFWIEFANCQPGSCGSTSVGPVGHGYIAAGSTYRTVRVELSDLQPSSSYTYWVFAINSAGWTKGSSKEFKAVNPGGFSTEPSPLPPIENTPKPFERPVEPWVGSRAQEGVERELHKEEEARKAREAANQPPAPLPVPKGEWCGEAGVTCAGGEVALAGARIVVRSDGMALLKLDCSGNESCSGKLTLSAKVTSRARGRKGRSRTIAIGTAKFSIAAGKAVVVKMKLDGAARGLLHAAHGRLTARLTILELTPGPENTQAKTVQLVQRK